MAYQPLKPLTAEQWKAYSREADSNPNSQTASIFKTPEELSDFRSRHDECVAKNPDKPYAGPDFIYSEMLQQMGYNNRVSAFFGINGRVMVDNLKETFHHLKDENGNIRQRGGDERISNQKFNRTASEIVDQRNPNGCANFATVYSSLARDAGYDVAIVPCADANWEANKYKELEHGGTKVKGQSIHQFVEMHNPQTGQVVAYDSTHGIRSEIDYNNGTLKNSWAVGGTIFNSYFNPLERRTNFDTVTYDQNGNEVVNRTDYHVQHEYFNELTHQHGYYKECGAEEFNKRYGEPEQENATEQTELQEDQTAEQTEPDLDNETQEDQAMEQDGLEESAAEEQSEEGLEEPEAEEQSEESLEEPEESLEEPEAETQTEENLNSLESENYNSDQSEPEQAQEEPAQQPNSSGYEEEEEEGLSLKPSWMQNAPGGRSE